MQSCCRPCQLLACKKQQELLVLSRSLKKLKRVEDPELVKAKPIFQYVKDKIKSRTQVYSWGKTASGALGNPNFLVPITGKKPIEEFRRPGRVSILKDLKVRDVAAGHGFSLFAGEDSNKQYQLFGSGLNTDSQIGQQTVRGRSLKLLIQPASINVSTALSGKEKIEKVACGRAHSLCLTSHKRVLSLGNNSYGQCGRPIVDQEVYFGKDNMHVVPLEEPITDIVCGQDHSLFLTEAGNVYACGWGADGQTGLNTFESIWMPRKVAGDIEGERIVSISSSADGVLACSDKGDVFGWGNSEYAQLLMATDQMQLEVPRRFSFTQFGKAVKVAAGGTMCAVLNDKHQIFVWGYGILGKGPNVELLKTPELIPPTLFGCDDFNPDTKVTAVVAGLSSFAAITNQGDLYMWGKNRCGALGTNERRDVFFPIRIPVPAVVHKVSLGVDHTLALCHSL